jgi:hypothetical protein
MTTQARSILLAATILVLLVAGLTYEVVATRPVREAVRTYSGLVSLGNRTDITEDQQREAARRLCSSRYLSSRGLAFGPEGGIVGLPRTISKNFRAWREGENVWICPTNRIGPVYQFVEEGGGWRFDGLVAVLRDKGEIVKAADLPDSQNE